MEERVAITVERYNQLLRAEHDANHLKTLLADRASNYESIDFQTVIFLNTIYNGNKEDSKA